VAVALACTLGSPQGNAAPAAPRAPHKKLRPFHGELANFRKNFYPGPHLALIALPLNVNQHNTSKKHIGW